MRTSAAFAVAAALLVSCRRERASLTTAVALLPSELPVYRAVVAHQATTANGPPNPAFWELVL